MYEIIILHDASNESYQTTLLALLSLLLTDCPREEKIPV